MSNGVAHPVTMQGMTDTIMNTKGTNDAAAFIRTIAEKRHRNVVWAEEAVRYSVAPVLPTLSHPESKALGWQKFAALVRGYSLPVYALGGLRQEDLTTAWEHGGHGIAMMRAIA